MQGRLRASRHRSSRLQEWTRSMTCMPVAAWELDISLLLLDCFGLNAGTAATNVKTDRQPSAHAVALDQ